MKLSCIKYTILSSLLIFCFVHELNSQVADTIHIQRGWNMVSVHLKVQDYYYLTLFPDAISKPLGYFYQYEIDTLIIGKSYWIKFPSDAIYILRGEPYQSVIIDLPWVGWNMIGSITEPFPVNMIRSGPPGVISSDFFKYDPASGYKKSDTIKPGSGYWVKVSRSGKLSLSSSMGIPCPGIPTMEYAGKTYNTVQVGNQCWFRENLDVGTMINGSQYQTNNDTIEKYCYNDSIENCNVYGGLYQWDETMQYTTTPGTRGVCPSGWHIPTYLEFQTCSTTVGGDGNALKAIGQGGNGGIGSNISGFSALLTGYYHFYYREFMNFGYAFIWSSMEVSSEHASPMRLFFEHDEIYFSPAFNKTDGFSVRCLKD